MRVAFWSEYGRGVCRVAAAAGLAFAVAGCSSGVSRFDFPTLGLSDNSSSDADLTTTSSLPVPAESVYSPGRYHYYGDPNQSGGQISRSSLPPPQSTAEYTPHLKPQAYGTKPPAPPPLAQASGPRVKVQRGDTLSSLSQRYGVPMDEIQSANNLADARLREGQELIMPGAKVAASPKPAPRVAAATPAPSSPAPRPGETVYTVQAGDTPHAIAEKLGADQKSILVRNDVRADALQIGQKLIIPAGSDAPTLAQAPDAPAGVRKVKTTTIPAPGAAPVPESTQSTAKASPEVTGESPQRVASTTQLPNPDPMSGASFRWPVKGRIVSGFGTKPDGGHNDGINISVPQGTSVKAAENGVVAYAGSELKGYGNLVLVRHANNWVSAYANNEELLVKRGDKVRRGQIIAKAGATGSVSQPQVHFELRKGSRPVDPTKYMSSMAAQAD
jgi:murein DD-endopeptidase MepM/ murein hydrolase activator NlpD